ncbi:MAG: hypothetical protein K0R41_1733 [Geminicoccaceae bacterium]|nr:hypothetical protein [Geminicoccaceae bacterium]
MPCKTPLMTVRFRRRCHLHRLPGPAQPPSPRPPGLTSIALRTRPGRRPNVRACAPAPVPRSATLARQRQRLASRPRRVRPLGLAGGSAREKGSERQRENAGEGGAGHPFHHDDLAFQRFDLASNGRARCRHGRSGVRDPRARGRQPAPCPPARRLRGAPRRARRSSSSWAKCDQIAGLMARMDGPKVRPEHR